MGISSLAQYECKTALFKKRELNFDLGGKRCGRPYSKSRIIYTANCIMVLELLSNQPNTRLLWR